LLHDLEQRATDYPEIKQTMETKSYTNKFCLKKVLEGFDLLEYGNRGKRKSVPQFGSHPVEQKIEQQITTEMKTTEMKLCIRQNLKLLPEEYVCP
jgi:hypothetical protein